MTLSKYFKKENVLSKLHCFFGNTFLFVSISKHQLVMVQSENLSECTDVTRVSDHLSDCDRVRLAGRKYAF